MCDLVMIEPLVLKFKKEEITIPADEFERSNIGDSNRQMGPELIHVFSYESELGEFQWSISEYPVGCINDPVSELQPAKGVDVVSEPEFGIETNNND